MPVPAAERVRRRARTFCPVLHLWDVPVPPQAPRAQAAAELRCFLLLLRAVCSHALGTGDCIGSGNSLHIRSLSSQEPGSLFQKVLLLTTPQTWASRAPRGAYGAGQLGP